MARLRNYFIFELISVSLNITISEKKRSLAKKAIRATINEYHNRKYVPFICYSEIRDIIETIIDIAQGKDFLVRKLNVKGDTFSANITPVNNNIKYETIKIILSICYKPNYWEMNGIQFKNRFELHDAYFELLSELQNNNYSYFN